MQSSKAVRGTLPCRCVVKHCNRAWITHFRSNIQSERLKVEAVRDVVSGLDKISRGFLKPSGNNHLSKGEFPGGNDICLGPSPSLQMLNQIYAGAHVGRDPTGRGPESSYPYIRGRHETCVGCLTAKKF